MTLLSLYPLGQVRPLTSLFALFVIFSLVSLIGVASPAGAQSGISAFSLDYVAKDISNKCNATVFQGSDGQSKTLFVTPKVMLSDGPDGKGSAQINSNGDGTYTLNINLYFPSDAGMVNASNQNAECFMAPSLSQASDPCTSDEIKANYNALHKGNPVEVVSEGPVASISVDMLGPNNKHLTGSLSAFRYKDGGISLIEYSGRTLTVSLQLNEEQKNYFENQVKSQGGLPISVFVGFSGANRTGSVHASLQSKDLVGVLSANIGVSRKLIARVDFEAALKKSLSQIQYKFVQYEQSASLDEMRDSFARRALDLIDSGLAETKGLPTVDGCGSADDSMICVQTALQVLSRDAAIKLSFNQYMPNLVYDLTQLRIEQTETIDPLVEEIRLTALQQDPTTDFEINAGETVSIAAFYSFKRQYNYERKQADLSDGQLEAMDLKWQFPLISQDGFKVVDVTHNGLTYAVGRNANKDQQHSVSSFVSYFNSFSLWFSQGSSSSSSSPTYRWVWTRLIPHVCTEQTHYFDNSLTVLENLPFTISFLANGQMEYGVGDLLKPNPFFTARFDDSSKRLMITAKQHLGAMHFHQRISDPHLLEKYSKDQIRSIQAGEPPGEPTQPNRRPLKLVSESVAQEEITPSREVKISDRTVLATRANIEFDTTYVLLVTRPQLGL